MNMMYKTTKKQLENSGAGEAVNCAARCCFKCCDCCMACFERFIRFVNENAYIMMAYSGESFCNAAGEAFYLIMRNAG
jgi:hypothetical protein